MHAASPALIVAALVTAFVCSGSLWQLCALRHTFEIAARAPVLIGICGTGCLTVVVAIFVHWILVLEAKGLPCYVMLLASYFCIAFFMSPYCRRGVQLVVAYNTQYRLKYARYVKFKNIFKMSAAIGAAVFVVALLVLRNMQERYARTQGPIWLRVLQFNERRVVEFTLLLGIGPTIYAMFKLLKMHDVFGIGLEIVRVIVPIVIGGVIYSILQELLHAKVLEGSRAVHFGLEMTIFVAGINLIFWSALAPVSRYYGWFGGGKMFVLPLEGPTSQSDGGKEGVYEHAQEGGEVAEIFGEFCRLSLCMESWEFVVGSVAYKNFSDPNEQFARFIRIVDQYLRPTSPQEVNLGSKMQDRLLPFQTISTFTGPDEVTRSTILEEPVDEIVMMLEQNLLAKFKLTTAMQQRKLVEIDIQSARDVADGDEGMLELMTSVSLGEMRYPMGRAGAEEHSRSLAARSKSPSLANSSLITSRRGVIFARRLGSRSQSFPLASERL